MKLCLCFTPFQTVLKSIISLTKFNALLYMYFGSFEETVKIKLFFSTLYSLNLSIIPHSIASKQVEQDITD